MLGNNGKMRPVTLHTFRFTAASRGGVDQVAATFGGTVTPWEKEWEVITDTDTVGVIIPPRDQVISQNYELWSKSGCQRRCDSQHEQIGNRPCLCPSDPIERSVQAQLNPPQACKPITRINLMIPDLPGLGVWRLGTASFYAAVELGDSAELMEEARKAGAFLEAQLRRPPRTSRWRQDHEIPGTGP